MINTVEQFIETLNEIEILDFPKAIKNLNITPEALSSYATWTGDCYTRNCLARSEKYELILLCWDCNAKTPIHDHGGEDCWVYQVAGTVEEVRFDLKDGNLIESSRIKLTPGKLTFMNDVMGYHSIQNDSGQRAMTFHIYASPIDSCKIYDDDKECFETKVMSYDSVAEVESEFVLA